MLRLLCTVVAVVAVCEGAVALKPLEGDAGGLRQSGEGLRGSVGAEWRGSGRDSLFVQQHSGSQLGDACCPGPPSLTSNPLGVSRIAKVTLSVADIGGTAQFWSRVLGFQKFGPEYPTPFASSVQRLALESQLFVELLYQEGSTDRTPRPNPPHHLNTYGFASVGFLVADRDRVDQQLSATGINAVMEYRDEQQETWNIVIRDPTTDVLVEFVQPFDNGSWSIDYSTNPMGILGYHHLTMSVEGSLLKAAKWYQNATGAIMPYATVSSYPIDSTIAFGVSQVEKARIACYANPSALPDKQPSPNPPKQATLRGLVSYALSVDRVWGAEGEFLVTGHDILYTYSDPDFGRSFWGRDYNGVLIEFNQKTPTTSPSPSPSSV